MRQVRSRVVDGVAHKRMSIGAAFCILHEDGSQRMADEAAKKFEFEKWLACGKIVYSPTTRSIRGRFGSA
jgi:hypothetical protein